MSFFPEWKGMKKDTAKKSSQQEQASSAKTTAQSSSANTTGSSGLGSNAWGTAIADSLQKTQKLQSQVARIRAKKAKAASTLAPGQIWTTNTYNAGITATDSTLWTDSITGSYKDSLMGEEVDSAVMAFLEGTSIARVATRHGKYSAADAEAIIYLKDDSRFLFQEKHLAYILQAVTGKQLNKAVINEQKIVSFLMIERSLRDGDDHESAYRTDSEDAGIQQGTE